MNLSAPVRIFSSVGCSFCAKAKGRLQAEDVSYLEFDIDRYPNHHAAAQASNGIFTVPVIYFGPTLIGGNDDLQKIPANRIKAAIDASLPNGFTMESGLPDFLRVTAEDVAAADAKLAAKQAHEAGESKVNLPGLPAVFNKASNQTVTYNEILGMLKGPKGPELGNRGGIICSDCNHCMTGKDVVTSLAEQLWEGKRDLGLRSASLLLKVKMIVPASAKTDAMCVVGPETEDFEPAVLNKDGKKIAFVDSEKAFYHFQEKKMLESKSLNTHRIYNPLAIAEGDKNPLSGEVNTTRTADAVGFDLRKRLAALLAQFMDPEGRWVDYLSMGKSPQFADYQDATTELQVVNLTKLSRAGLISFGINIYNSCIIHAFATIGPAGDSMYSKYKFFNGVGYTIGGLHYSLNDIENGILRGNRKAMGAMSVPFGKDDARLAKGIVSPVDHRIHFSLNCGAKSCPAIKVFTEDGLDDKLTLASKGFLESSVWSPANNTLQVTKIIDWYNVDFAPDAVLSLVPYLKDGAAIKAAHAIKPVKLIYAEYDWSVNAKPLENK